MEYRHITTPEKAREIIAEQDMIIDMQMKKIDSLQDKYETESGKRIFWFWFFIMLLIVIILGEML